MKKLTRTHKTKDEKRRLLLTKKNVKQETRIAKYGSDSVAVVAKDMNHRFIAAFMALVFAISCLVIGVNFATQAENEATSSSAASSNLVVDKTISLAASGDTTVYITKTGECYHADGCASLRRSKIETTLQNAVDKGFRACSKCHPASLDASTSTSTTAATTTAKASVTTNSAETLSPEIEALKTYKGNTI